MRSRLLAICCLVFLPASTGCLLFPEWTLHTADRVSLAVAELDPDYEKKIIDSLRFTAYLPSTVLGDAPEFKLEAAGPEAIVFRYLRELDSVPDAARVLQLMISEREQTADSFPELTTDEDCVAGSAAPQCRVWRVTPLGREVFGWRRRFYFLLGSTLIHVSSVRHAGSADPYEYVHPPVDYEWAPGDLDAFVDSFAEADLEVLYRMEYREGMTRP